MRRAVFSGAMRAMLWVVVFVAAPAFAATGRAAAKPVVDLRPHPTGKTPVDVSVGLYITNFVAIDETRESFEVGGYLTAKWRDPRLALSEDRTTDAQTPPRTFRLEGLWTPSIASANSISHKTTQYYLAADRNGLVTYVERFDADVSNAFALAKLPFDTQDLRFEIHPFISATSERSCLSSLPEERAYARIPTAWRLLRSNPYLCLSAAPVAIVG